MGRGRAVVSGGHTVAASARGAQRAFLESPAYRRRARSHALVRRTLVRRTAPCWFGETGPVRGAGRRREPSRVKSNAGAPAR